MSTNVTWNGTVYSIPASGETGWPALDTFLIALGTNAAISQEMKQAMRVATTTPVTVADTTDCVVAVKLASAGAVAVTLPAGTSGRWFVIADQTGDAATNNITITPNGAETINGAATYVINENRGSVVLAYSTTNTQWNVVARFSAGAVLTNPYASAFTVSNTTDTTSGSTGAIITAGGLGVAKNIWSSALGTFTSGVKVKNTGAGSDTLSHYEEGTFTPTIIATGTAGTVTYTTQVGAFTRIGRCVFFNAAVAWSNWTGSPTGSLQVGISGIGYTAKNTANLYNNIAVQLISIDVVAATIGVVGELDPNTQAVFIVAIRDAATSVTTDPALNSGATARSVFASGFFFV